MKPAELAKQQAKADEAMRRDWKVENGLLVFDGMGYDNMLADKIILEVNTIQPPELEGIHDVALLGIAPNRKPIGINRVSDRIGSPYMDVDPNKVVAVVLTESGDRVNKFNPPDPVSTAIGDHVVAFLKQEEAAGRLPKGRLLPLQSGIDNVANAVLAGLARAGYRGLECHIFMVKSTEKQ